MNQIPGQRPAPQDPDDETRLFASVDDERTELISHEPNPTVIPETATTPETPTTAPEADPAPIPEPQPAPIPEPVEESPAEEAPAEDTVDPLSDTLHPAMATSVPEGASQNQPMAEVKSGDVHAGRYRLEQQLAQRGGTLTWRAFDQKLSRSVLVHILAPHDPRTPDVLDAARKAAFATDSRFLRVLDAVVGEQPGEPSLVVCEFAPGESLEKLLRQGPLSALEAAWVARELADAMQSMHSEGLFHQRINPDTVIITSTGNVKIVGFLIEAAMYPDAEEGTLAWSEREQADVMAIGKVLYASLVTRWPTAREQAVDESGQPRRTWGMAAAPMDARGWLTPRQVRSGVSPALDIICDQILSDAPRHNELPLRTANQVMLALSKVLGTADGSADLERRMRYPVVPSDGDAGGPLLETTGSLSAVGGPDEQTQAGQAHHQPSGPFTAVPPPGRASSASSASDDGFDAASPATPSVTRRPGATSATRPPTVRHSRPPRRRWLIILVALLALVLLVSLIRVALHKDGTGGVLGGGGDEQQADTVQISAVNDFDPTGDGGNGEENPSQVKLAFDGNPATAWQSLVYLGDPKLGRLKPGVGLVVDLGQRQKVSGVKLTLKGSPTAVQLRVPADTGSDSAPATSQKQWTTVASQSAAGTSTELKPDQAVETRYLLIYLTSLPKVSGNRYQAAIAEIEVNS
ncbi:MULTISPECIES: protein kinase family protein [unclassified Luteococcus]|uniref:protein kinase family protein n=1 Tax=unclassified Luteococcus TaxID=2639923 RepID=UPI00313ED964